MSDYYGILGVARDATEQEIKRAYRKLAQKYHPDKHKGKDKEEYEEKFKDINNAYSVLIDQEKRGIYDQFGEDGLNGQAGFGQGGFDASMFGNINDIFNQFFGQSTGGYRKGPKSGSDIEINIDFELEDYFHGVTKEIEYKQLVRCTSCDGKGSETPNDIETCKKCHGNGEILVQQGPFQMQQTCPSCQGEGTIIRHKCKSCNGKGRVYKTNRYKFELLTKYTPGTRVRVRDLGNAGERGAPNGNLLIGLGLRNHPLYKIDQYLNLELTLPISMTQACLGDKVIIEHFTGPIEIKIEPGIANGVKKIVRDKGLMSRHGRTDLIVVIEIETLQDLSKEQKELLEKLAETMKDNKNNPKSNNFFTRMKKLFKK